MPRRRDPAPAVHMLDLLAEFFDGGRRWLKNDFHDGDGNCCLISALAHLRAVLKVQGDGTAYYLRLAQRQDERPRWCVVAAVIGSRSAPRTTAGFSSLRASSPSTRANPLLQSAR
jgi:hypothetical protein